ncbi:MAG: hypothetical protein H6Q73_886 [Firmicutes bacterium]|nr:hypothetical protein [Bacillota bacterium]
MTKVYINIEADSAEEALRAARELAAVPVTNAAELVAVPEPEKPTRSRSNKAVQSKKAELEPEPTAPVEIAPEPVEEPQPEQEEPKAPTYTLVEVRAKLQELAKSGKQAKVKGLLTNLGFSKLTDVPEEKYGELMTSALELG